MAGSGRLNDPGEMVARFANSPSAIDWSVRVLLTISAKSLSATLACRAVILIIVPCSICSIVDSEILEMACCCSLRVSPTTSESSLFW